MTRAERRALALAALLAGALAPPPALAQAAQKLACAPVTVTRCDEAGKCETREATAREKEDVLTLDFAAGKATMRRGERERPLGDIADMKEQDGKRSFVIRSGERDRVELTLDAAGKLEGKRDGGRRGFVAQCAPA